MWGFKALQADKSLGTVSFQPFLFKGRWRAIVELIEKRPTVLDEITQQVIDAEVEYKKSLGKNQKSYEGNFNLGDAYYKQGKYDEAARQFELLKSQKKDKSIDAAALHNLGNTLLQGQKYPESIEAYKQALKMNPKDEDTRYNLAYAQAMLKQQQQQQQQQQNQDKNKDKKDQQKQQQEQQKQEQQKQEQKPQEQKKEISKEDAERILQALNNDEKDKHKKKAKVAATRIRIDKDW